MTTNAKVWQLLEPSLALAGYELVDVECVGLGSPHATVRVRVDHLVEPADLVPPGPVDLEAIAAATRVVDAVLEDADPIEGRYTLEVSSPGLERPLRTPAQFRRFVGATVKVKTTAAAGGDRRLEGRLESADEPGDGAGVVVAGRHVSYEQIERAHTVFVWGAAAKPTKGDRAAKSAPSSGAGKARTPGAQGRAAGSGTGRSARTDAGVSGGPVPSNDNEVNEVTVR